jgi:hypothetical protein
MKEIGARTQSQKSQTDIEPQSSNDYPIELFKKKYEYKGIMIDNSKLIIQI